LDPKGLWIFGVWSAAGFVAQRSVPGVLAIFTSLATCLTAETLAIKLCSSCSSGPNTPCQYLKQLNIAPEAIIHDSLYNLSVHDDGVIRLR
jgi:hypothetical protein